MNESNRRIASLNRIDEVNQRVAVQNDPLIASWAAKTPSRWLKSPPRPSKEGPRAPKSGPRPPQDDPRTSPGPLLGRSWSHLGAMTSQDRKKVAPRQWSAGSRGRFWLPKWVPKRPQDDPKTSQKSKQKMHDFFDLSWTRLGPVLRPSWAHLGVKKVALALRFSIFFEHHHFRSNDSSRRIFDPT